MYTLYELGIVLQVYIWSTEEELIRISEFEDIGGGVYSCILLDSTGKRRPKPPLVLPGRHG